MRWRPIAVMLAVTLLIVVGVVAFSDEPRTTVATQADAAPSTAPSAEPSDTGQSDSTSTVQPTTTSSSIEPTTTSKPRLASDLATLAKVTTISGTISPKSVVASGRGTVTAQNMMYQHSVTVYGSDTALLATIPDTVDLAALGHPQHVGSFKGAPVEAAFTPDGRYEYITNYSMYGPGFGPEGSDKCNPNSGFDNSFVYRIDTSTWKIDQAIEVGAVPKYIAITPDGKRALVTNWCSYSLSVIDLASAKVTSSISLGAYPRGIAITSDSQRAYVAIMGSTTIAQVNLATSEFITFAAGGQGPRHIVLSPDNRWLYATLNGAGVVVKIDTATRQVVNTVRTGSNPRSMDISADGTALYVVNYKSDTMTKLRSSDMSELQTIATNHHPIGIAYDKHANRVWVACYVGNIIVFDDK